MTEKDIAKLNAQLFAHTVAINLIIKSLPDELGVAIAQDVTDEVLLEEFFAGFEEVFQNWDPEVRAEFETTVRASFSFLLEDIRN